MRRLLLISLCLFGVGVLLLLVLRSARRPAAVMDEPEREPYWEPEPVAEAEPEPDPEPAVEAESEPDLEPAVEAESEPEPVVEAESEPEPVVEADPEQEPVVDLPEQDVVAPAAKGDDGRGRMAEAAALRAEIVERVERRPLFVMAEERNVPYFRLFFMTKQELVDAILEVEHVPPDDVMPSQEALDRVREIAAEEAELKGQASA